MRTVLTYFFTLLVFLISAASVRAATVDVSITSGGFSPSTVNITAGDTVRWTNNDTVTHNVSSNPHPSHTDYSALNLGNVEPGNTLTLAFSTAGTYGYHDHLNSSLTGAVAVVAAATAAVSAPNGGECLQGGSTFNITWSMTGVDHLALAYKNDGSTPATWSSSAGSYFAHPTSGTSYNWSAPNETTGTARIWLDWHNSGHTSLGQDSSNNNFSIDASAPTAAIVSSPSKTSTMVNLSWTAATDAGCKGLTGYKILRNGTEIATGLTGTTYADSGLAAGTAYTYVVRAYDDFHSTDSNTLAVTTNAAPDTTAPAAVTNLVVSGTSSSSATLTWTAPGDDNGSGTASSYEVRYSTSVITSGNFSAATLAAGAPAPQAAGTMQALTVSGLAAGTTYFFALKTSDEVPNVSGLSNVASGTTAAAASSGGGVSTGISTVATITLSTPNGGETLVAGTAVPIVWSTSGGSVGSIRLLLSTDGGATYPVTIASGLTNSGLYNWTVPAVVSIRARVKAEAINGTTSTDVSNADFVIQAAAAATTTAPSTDSAGTTASTATTSTETTTTTTAATSSSESSVPAADPTSTGRYVPSTAVAATPSIDVDKEIPAPEPAAPPAPCVAGKLIKGSRPDVYYCGKDGRRYIFPNEKVYFTWFRDFKGVQAISDADLAKIRLGGNVTYKPGVRMVKIQSEPKVYAVARGGLLRWIKSEAVAKALYGPDWNRKIDDISDALFFSYKLGEPIDSAE